MERRIIALAIGAILGWAAAALAHPGHGVTNPSSPPHYLVEPVHAGIAAVVAATALVAGAWAYLYRRRG